mmetsp:Transcript_21992/g.62434  ORF Transcript_21992/g.62434 Transcript_21992/m.62434 type:complete len:230 (+) Transcript_21992:675-1364(+)
MRLLRQPAHIHLRKHIWDEGLCDRRGVSGLQVWAVQSIQQDPTAVQRGTKHRVRDEQVRQHGPDPLGQEQELLAACCGGQALRGVQPSVVRRRDCGIKLHGNGPEVAAPIATDTTSGEPARALPPGDSQHAGQQGRGQGGDLKPHLGPRGLRQEAQRHAAGPSAALVVHSGLVGPDVFGRPGCSLARRRLQANQQGVGSRSRVAVRCGEPSGPVRTFWVFARIHCRIAV